MEDARVKRSGARPGRGDRRRGAADAPSGGAGDGGARCHQPDGVTQPDHGRPGRQRDDQRRADGHRPDAPRRRRGVVGGAGVEQRRTVVAAQHRDQRGGRDGEYSLEVYPEATTYYRFVFLGTDTYAAVDEQRRHRPHPGRPAALCHQPDGFTRPDHSRLRRQRDDQRRADRHRQRSPRRRRGAARAAGDEQWRAVDVLARPGDQRRLERRVQPRCRADHEDATTASSSMPRPPT